MYLLFGFESEVNNIMNILKIACVVIWVIAGTLVLTSGNVSKFDYALIWIVLMLNLIVDVIKG